MVQLTTLGLPCQVRGQAIVTVFEYLGPGSLLAFPSLLLSF